MFDGAPEIVIQGITETGETFRPGDWAERLNGMLPAFSAKGHLAYSSFLKPIMAGGVRCVVVDRILENRDPPAFEFLLQFARDNRLKLRQGRKTKRPEDLAAEAALRDAMLPPGCQGNLNCGTPATGSGRSPTNVYAIALTAAFRRLL